MKVVVIGCTHAGTAAVQQILARAPETEVTVYERTKGIAFLSCGISLYLQGTVPTLEEMCYASPDDLTKLGAQVNMYHDVFQVDTQTKTLWVQDLATGKKFQDHYDKLIMTTGSVAVVPPLQGVSVPRVQICKNYHDAKMMKAAAQDAKRIAIVGAGYIGVELAESYSSTGHEVLLINSSTHILKHYIDPPLAAAVTEDMQAHGVELYLNEQAQKFDSDQDHVYIQTDKMEHEADLAIVCVGFRPQTDLLQGQVTLSKDGAFKVNDYLQTSDPDIYAAGDSVASHFNPSHEDAYTPLATCAVRQGVLVGRNVVGQRLKYRGTQATSALHLYGRTVASTGLTLRYAKKAGYNAAAVDLTDNYRPEFMPSTTPIKMRLVYDRDTQRILGGQLSSHYNISQSANTLSVCIQNENTVEDLAFVDMLFSPHDDRPFHYLNLLGQAALAQIEAEQGD
ncbi:FAD-dependent oxidoreductase [Loigolactobacillus bifermentans]|uniref:NADH oxidase n=1 Tax=Loigolactobacillus bifermentans DSM 20003 TaxID=1423726 RepID=A0A0R1H918_9LACO|nr:FAD-dependent oxidoreductase [Loigolactobacillus bifermentans]KRK40417.1 NADH oxidase [Loigolactobacillus bifermentans DSM 20003]QGG61029.1 SidA/IucD/PvdA family monooxygenase [Loigolactobacillus bifermentans]